MTMPRFIFAYHGGKRPETPEAGAAAMAQWQAWFGKHGAAITDGGGPAGPSQTVTAQKVVGDGGANPISGYTFVEASDMDAAIKIAKDCPILPHGTVEIAQIMSM
jgi:hypothetical protein